MKFLLFLLLLLLPAVAIAQQGGYELDAWFWHRHLSTRDSLFTQDYDNDAHKDFIPVHLYQEDFEYLDSVAEAIGLWSSPDTITAPQAGIYEEMMKPNGWKMFFYFKTPRHPQRKAVVSRTAVNSLKIYDWESAILRIMDRQPYYNTLPKPMTRQ